MAEVRINVEVHSKNVGADLNKVGRSLDELGKKAGVTNAGVSQMGRGFEQAAQRLTRFNPIAARASGLLGGFGPIGFAVGAGLGAAALGFRELVQESERLTKEAARLKISTDEYQKSLGITVPLTKDAIEAGVGLGKAWNDLTTSGKNLALNALTPIAEALADISKEFLKGKDDAEAYGKAMQGAFAAGKGVGSLTPGGIDPFTADALRRAGINIGSARVGPARLGGLKPSADVNLGGFAPWTEEDWLSWKRQTEELAESTGKAAKSVGNLSKAHERAIEDMQTAALRMFDPSGFSTPLSVRRAEGSISIPSPFAGLPGAPISEFGVIPPSFGIPPGAFDNVLGGLGESLDESTVDFGLSLSNAADLLRVFGDDIGEFGTSIVQSAAIGTELGDVFKDLELEGEALKLSFAGAAAFIAAWGATETGSTGNRALKGAASGAMAGMSVAGPWGAVVGAGVGALVGWLRGRGPAQVGEDAGRDMGVALSQALMEEIHKSGENAQMFLREIFAEGDLGIDRFAEEVGDLFSFFERGEISEESLIGELKETLPILIEHFDELGASGQAQIQRILGAAESLGLEMSELIDLVQAGFAPDTMEQIATTFGITNDQVRELSSLLGVSVQTDLERMAATLGLSVSEFEALGAAVKEKFGIPMDQIDELMASLGVGADELAAALGVEVAAGAGGLTEETAAANAELERGVGLSGLLAFNLERAAGAAGGIRFPDSGGGIPETGAQHGFHGDVVGPRAFVIERGMHERVDIGPSGRGSGGSGAINVTVSVDARGAIGLNERALADVVALAVERNLSESRTRLKKQLT